MNEFISIRFENRLCWCLITSFPKLEPYHPWSMNSTTTQWNSSQQTKHASFRPIPIWVHQSEINQYVRFHLTCGHILINQVNLSPRLAELWHYELKTFTKRPSVLESAADRGLQSSCAIVNEFIWITFDNRLFSMLDHIISNAQPYRRWTMNKTTQ